MAHEKTSRSQILVSVIGTDRPGIVEEVSGWILSHGGNIETSRMALLGGEFAGLILVSGGPELKGNLAESLADFEGSHRLTLTVKQVASGSGSGNLVMRYALQATALDHAGIVHKVSGILRQHEVNIISADTKLSLAPFSGSPVFHFNMQVDIPASVPVRRLRQTLEDYGAEQNVDFRLEPVE